MTTPHPHVYELLTDNHPRCGCGHVEPHVPCGGPHRIYLTDVPFEVGDFIYWNSTQSAYLPALEGNCDLMVISVDPYKTWFCGVNVGEFNIKNFTLKGSLYINSTGVITNTKTSTKIGFIENGHLYLLIENVPVSSSSLRITAANTFTLGSPVVYTAGAWALATPATGCDFIVVGVDANHTWFDVANTGVFNINKPELIGKVYLSDASLLTTTVSAVEVGFSYSGGIALNIRMTSNTPITPTIGIMSFDSAENSGYIATLGGF